MQITGRQVGRHSCTVTVCQRTSDQRGPFPVEPGWHSLSGGASRLTPAPPQARGCRPAWRRPPPSFKAKEWGEMHAAQSGRPQQRCLSQRRLPQPGSQLEHPRQLEHPAWAPPAPSLSLPARPAAHGVPAGAGRLPSGWHVARIVDQGVRLRLDCGTAWRRGRQVVIISQPAGQSQWPAAPLGKPCFADCSMPTPGSAAACTTPLAAEAASRTPLPPPPPPHPGKFGWQNCSM